MKPLKILIFLCLLTSCDFFESQEKKTQQRINEKLKSIDWNAIDSYPLFEVCDEFASKTIQRECFENELLKHCSKSLSAFEYSFDKTINRTILVDLLVDKEGRIAVLNINKDAAIDEHMPEFDTIIKQTFKEIPALAPALKMGMPVMAKFRLPIEFSEK